MSILEEVTIYYFPMNLIKIEKINLNISVFESEFPCFITTEEECYKEAKKQGFKIGSSSTNTPFASTGYSTKTCYGFSSGKYGVAAFFGLGGTLKDYVTYAYEGSNWKALYKQCLAAGTTILPF